ncbi:type II secretion system F family protein [Lacisediminihabitans profunda]|uniref:Pilus assembly protein n=1 Tax=Lacisediminihabitans profunda TaxID=2594790 RepID=A0A5C8URU1_9MICO|nr:type II secretion system F family protein [Lacisediminihabitans profunda]TXN31301.1 pilus assembly protein [Lacisediminihabitans profunda]
MVQLTSLGGWAVLAGTALGVGLWSLVSLVPRLGRPRLADRVAPYLVDVAPGARELLGRRSADPLPVFWALLAPIAAGARRALGSLVGGSVTIQLRLRQSGSGLSVEAFRSRELGWALGGAVAGVFAALAIGRAQSPPAVVYAIIVVGSAIGGVLLRDFLLQRAARLRLQRLSSELPTVLEFLTLSLSAGEGILDAIRRVARVSHGELAAEFGAVVAAVNTGLPLGESLAALAEGVRLPALTRCVEQITGALDRGTPLSEVLRAQAQDSRDEAKRELLEVAGKKEVAMLVPLVFLILPVTIVFAIFPGIFVLQLGR